MAKNEKFNEEDGVWRTIGGRRVFIKTGQSLSEAMIQSGKFKNIRSDYRKAKEEDEKKKKDELELTDKQKEAGEKLNQNAEKGAREDISEYLKGNNVDFDSDEDFVNELSKEWGIDKEKAQKMFNEGKLIEKEKPEGVKTLDKLKDTNVKTFGDEIKEENERLEIAKDIAKELYGLNEKNASPERLEKEAKKVLEYADGEVLDKGDAPYTNSKGELERSTKSLKEWRDSLKKTSEDGFTSKSTNPFYPDKDYSKEDLNKMAENGVKPMKDTYSGSGWEGVNSNKNLSTKEQAKAITDAMKEKYPDVKISRKSELYSGGSSIHLDIMSSDKDLYVSDADIDKMSLQDLSDVTRSNNFNWWAKENVPGYNENRAMYSEKDVKNYAKERLAQMKKGDNQSVRGDEWYLSDYGKKVVSDLNKEANSYTYDDSDAMTDYFNHGTYMWVNIGKYDKPYQVNEKKSTNETMNNAIREKAGSKYYEGTKRWGFGYANDDNIPVYQNKIDYSGDFTHANLSKVSDDDLVKIANKQNELYNEATGRQVGDRRTYNGKKDQIFKDTETLRYGNGLDVVSKEMEQRGLKADNQITNTLKEKAYKKYLKEHPGSKMTFNEFKDMRKQ